MERQKVNLLVVGNVICKQMLTGGGKTASYICYATKENYEAERTIYGDYTLQGETGIIAATGNIAFIREGM